MAYIFMDESGCLGFDFTKSKPTRYFIITFLCVDNKRPIEKIPRHLFHAMPEKERLYMHGILHAHQAHPRLRVKLLHRLREQQEVSIMVIRLNKRRVYTRFQDEKPVLYNYVTNILLDRIFNKKLVAQTDTIHFVASRRETNRFLNENFKAYLHEQNADKGKLDVSIKTPAEEKCLQVVDFVSWAVFRHYEHGDSSYYDIIRDLIVEDSTLFGGG